MARRRLPPDTDGGPTLRDVRLAVIEVECRRCARKDSLERAALVKMHGAGFSFSRLRRRVAMGCERMNHPEGDVCETRFPCLLAETSV